VKSSKKCFAINSYNQAVETIKACKNKKIFPVLYINFYIISGLGADWLKEFKNLLQKKFSKKSFSIIVDCKNHYGLFLELTELKIDYIKIKSDKNTFNKLKQIATKNKVLLNPNFSIVDLTKIVNIDLKIERIAKK